MILTFPRQRCHGFTRTQWVVIIFLVVLAFEGGVRVAENKLGGASKPKPQATNHPMTAPTEVAEEPPPQTNEVVEVTNVQPRVQVANTNPPLNPSPLKGSPNATMIKANYQERVHKVPQSARPPVVFTNGYGIRIAVP